VPELLLAGFAALVDGGYEHGGPAVRRAIGALAGPDSTDQQVLDRLDLGVTFCTLLWDDRSRQAILSRAEIAARRTGALYALDLVTFMQAMADATQGRLLEADRHDATGQRLRKAIGITADQELVWRHPELVAWRAGPDDRAALLPGLRVNFRPGHQDTWVDYHNDKRAPLLFVSGSEDHIMPPAIQESNCKHCKSNTVTERREYEGYAHLLPAQKGWEQIADEALDWTGRHAG
jgi:pimeloyl-ACP methyl ester carboxylesterase